jgi:hypothetical protein
MGLGDLGAGAGWFLILLVRSGAARRDVLHLRGTLSRTSPVIFPAVRDCTQRAFSAGIVDLGASIVSRWRRSVSEQKIEGIEVADERLKRRCERLLDQVC